MTPTEHVIDLDRMHRAIRSGDRWALQRRQPDGSHDTLETWDGGRRSLYQRLEKRNIVPSRDADLRLARLPEAMGFRER